MTIATILVPVLLGIRAELHSVHVSRVSADRAGVYAADGKLAKEATIRVRAALASTIGHSFDAAWTVRVDLPVGAGPSADLGAAVAALVVLGHCAPPCAPTVYVGELGLSGNLRPTRDVYAAVYAAAACKVPAIIDASAANAAASVPGHGVVWLADELSAVLGYERGTFALRQLSGRPAASVPFPPLPDLTAEYAPALAVVREHLAAGRSVLLRGNPGSGKMMIARRCAHRPIAESDRETVNAIHHAAGLVGPDSTGVDVRPFRAPHHTVSEAGLLGSPLYSRPGEVSLAHGGVLYLDEVPEFRRLCLEAVRAARRDGCVRYYRPEVELPARFGLVGSTNACPCGYHGTERCHCAADRIAAYQARIPAGLFDVTIDL